ncbi:hypothetical protein LSH36_497g02092 [Paralvinella palmiformis]|uniref:BTB domain-containing protein n=1 Tax=Paralvinella palmiformis TaxID=53620 RepID=A0AAD9MZ85_9ANNE|nr:hypothetical protein LSH36_497g02092 [Paralvinella palmiformis]
MATWARSLQMLSVAPPEGGESNQYVMDVTQQVTIMNFTENQQGSAILEKLHNQRKEGRFCDVRFHVQGSESVAHRNVLAACSPYFDALLKINKSGTEHITIECKDHGVFEVLLDYIYTGSIIVNRNNVEELIRLSNRFMIPKLKGYCCAYLERSMNVTNCFMTKDVAQKTGLSSFAKTAEAFIMANIMDVIQQEELLQFSYKKIIGLRLQ